MKYPLPMPKWLDHAFRHIGIREVPGKKHNPMILNWLIKLKAWWKEDETPWCGTFVAHCLQAAGYPVPKHWYRAKAYADYGTRIKTGIPFGAICVKARKGGGHVFFAVASSPGGSIIYGLGGNQANCVNITPFGVTEIDAVVWPPNGGPHQPLPVTENSAQVNAAKPGGSEA